MSEIIYGKNTVIEFIKSQHPIEEIWVTKQLLNKEPLIESYIKEKKLKCHITERSIIDKLVKGNHQGIVALVKDFTYYTIDEMLEDAKVKNESPLLVILDGLEDPHNLGAILRTCDCCGVHGV